MRMQRMMSVLIAVLTAVLTAVMVQSSVFAIYNGIDGEPTG